ncbi:hypothetical protein QFC22_004184 [Naganishia vaughanmartiniae]|uniref:Uncharacterized protein n=1 Tax=Naganishia vaughanmartiniae TaxID=1424756 RepID=A0ACC2X3C4_9TREE|nr:hypothetical protein QFC22_004184 [Naganishia vaughanmartiniae]
MIARLFSCKYRRGGRQQGTKEFAACGNNAESGDVSPPTPSLNLLLPSNVRVIVLAICLAFGNLVSSLLSNSLFVKLDVLADDLNIEETNLQWVFNSFQLPFACLVLVSGKAADVLGKKRVFLVGASANVIATLITGFMKNSTGFFACRAFAGVASALLMACNFALRRHETK